MYYIINMMIVTMILKVMNIVYVDESGLNREYRRAYARAKRGVKVYDTKPGKKEKRVNIVAGLMYTGRNKKHIGVHSYEGSTTSAIFEDWFEWQLLGEVPEGSVVIMDNASFHRKEALREIAARYGVGVLFLPAYTPELNAIEVSWANFKAWLRYNSSRFPLLDFAIDFYFNQFCS